MRAGASDQPSAPIVASGLGVTYGTTTALSDVSFSVEAGEVVALLGPNGAGKTSTLRCLEGYLTPTTGSARILGFDPVADHAAVVPHLGIMLQGGGVYPAMRVAETIRLFAAYYENPRDPSELMNLLGLSHVATTPWRRLSGGEQQRLSLALALVGRPSVVMLDEPTAGVDPEGRVVIRTVVESLRASGAAVVLTSHELSEVDAMADRHVFLSAGRLLFAGTTAELSARHGSAGSFGSTPGLDALLLANRLGVSVNEVRPGHYLLGGALGSDGVALLSSTLADLDAPLDRFNASGDLTDLYHALYAGEPAPLPAPEPRRRRRQR